MAARSSVVVMEQDDNYVKLQLHGYTLPMVNGLRRVILGDVETAAIDLVDFSDNSSVVCEEFIAHRLGLIPLKVEHFDQMKYPGDCQCQSSNCPFCSPVFDLDVVHPVDHPNETRTVTSGDLTLLSAGSMSGGVQPVVSVVNKDIPLVVLARGQAVAAQCIIRLGRGSIHAKWIPVSQCAFRALPAVRLEASMALAPEADKRAIAMCCPKDVFSFDERTKLLSVTDSHSCIYCQDCIKKAQDLGLHNVISVSEQTEQIAVGHSKDKKPFSIYEFEIESVGQHPPMQILSMAIENLERRLSLCRDKLLTMSVSG